MEEVEHLIDGINQFKILEEDRPKLLILVSENRGIETKERYINKVELDVDLNYNSDFHTVDQLIRKRLNEPRDKGIVLLHGKPGTGKTTYIRYLTAQLDKKILLLSPEIAAQATSPKLIQILLDNVNSILVIEDAEQLLQDRGAQRNSAISGLLNMADGLLADVLNIQIICTFNTDISKIDSALLRKGRLIAKYEFKELSLEKSRTLSRHLGFESKIEKPMLLTDIYNQSEGGFESGVETRKIGFN